VLATWANDYLNGLTATRYQGPADSEDAHTGLNLWIGRFAGACVRAVQDAAFFEARVQDLEGEWRARLGQVRADSATDLLLRALPGAPVLTVSSAAELVDRTFPAVNDAIARLTEAGVVAQISIGKRNRAFEAKEVIDAFTSLERQLASPAGDTRSSAASRPVTPRPPTG
jgi:phosphoglycolate phosphatase-like HAD superfamily hydrolase